MIIIKYIKIYLLPYRHTLIQHYKIKYFRATSHVKWSVLVLRVLMCLENQSMSLSHARTHMRGRAHTHTHTPAWALCSWWCAHHRSSGRYICDTDWFSRHISTLRTRTVMVLETVFFSFPFNHLIWLVAQEYFIIQCRRESYRSYSTIKVFEQTWIQCFIN
jgi:hypothetical protein